MTTLTLPVSIDIGTGDTQRAYQSTGAVRMRRRVSARKLRRWTVRVPLATRGEYETVVETWDANGTVAAMDWTTPDAEALRVRFVRAPEYLFRSRSHVSISIEVEEVL